MLGFGTIGQFAIGEIAIQAPEFIGPDKYWQNFPLPVRFLQGLASTQQQFTTYNNLAQIVSFSWFNQPPDLVVLAKARLLEANQRAFFEGFAQPVLLNWFTWLSEPVRIKPTLLTGDQPFLFREELPLVNFSYFNWLSEPVRQLAGLKFYLQRDLGRAEFIPLSFSAGLNTVELGDILLEALYAFKTPIKALVSIKIIPLLGTASVVIGTQQAAGIIAGSPQVTGNLNTPKTPTSIVTSS